MTAPVDLDALERLQAAADGPSHYRLLAALPSVFAELRAARQDAVRYRFLRDEVDLYPRDVFGAMCPQLNSVLDAAIDAAIAKGTPG